MEYKLTSFITNPFVITVILSRLAGYVFMLFYPLEGMILSIFLDMTDWALLGIGRLPKGYYHVLDKPIDYLQYLFLIPILWNTVIIIPYLMFLGLRTIALLLYEKTRNRRFFVLFPNIAEYLALAYFLNIRFNLGFDITSYKTYLYLYLFKLPQELWLHLLMFEGVTYKTWNSIGKKFSIKKVN